MSRPFLKGALLGGLSAAVVFTASAALAGSGIGGVFNLGVKNSVNATSTLVGKTAGAMLAVRNNGSGPAASFTVGKGKPPFAVSSTGKVPRLNADLLDGKDSSAFAPAGQSDLGAYCALVKAHPRSYHPGPCRGFAGAVDTTGSVGHYSSVALGTDGLPVVSYLDSTNHDLKVAHCGTLTCSSGNILTTVDGTGSVGFFTSIAIGSDGLPVVSYFDETNADLKVAHCGNVLCSSGNTLITVDAGGLYTSIAVGTDELPVVSYIGSGSDLRVVHCGNLLCSSGNTITQVDTGIGAEYTSIAIGTDGFPVVSYYDATNKHLKVAHCGNASCSAHSSIAVDTAGDVGQYTSIAIGTDGFPVVSYYDVTNGDLKVAHCGNASCASGNTLTPVDKSGNVGQYTSVAIGTDGLPVVSYHDVGNGALKLARCGNPSCSSGNTQIVLDSGSVGQFTSVAIESDGLPVISYRDVGNQDLKVARPPVG